jgi:hypothetical protein
MFRTFPLSIIRSLFTVHSAMVYVIQVCRQLSSRSICSCLTAVYKPVWHIPVQSVQWINSCWWTEELYGTCRVSCQNKFEKLVHLFGFIIKKFVTMHGHMNVKNQTHYLSHFWSYDFKFLIILFSFAKLRNFLVFLFLSSQQTLCRFLYT